MTTEIGPDRIEKFILPKLERLPVVAAYARSRGWPFVLAWVHRISGILLICFLLFHIYTLSFLKAPGAFDAKMRVFDSFIFVFLEWVLAIPVIVHALNGGRLILYEIFGSRKDDLLMRWVWAMSVVYVLLLAVMMLMGNQTATAGFFWLSAAVLSVALVVAVGSRVWKTAASAVWKFQRISGAFLFIMVPAHLLFMHLNPGFGHEASVVTARMQNLLIRILDLCLVISLLFHGGYGLLSIAKDFIPSRLIQNGIALGIIILLVIFGWVGVKLTLSI